MTVIIRFQKGSGILNWLGNYYLVKYQSATELVTMSSSLAVDGLQNKKSFNSNKYLWETALKK
jgi:hypothetical protein